MTKKILISTLLIGASLQANFIETQKCDQVIDKGVYQICFDYKAKGPKIVEYTLTKDMISAPSIDKRPRFYTEKKLKKKYRVNPGDYIYATSSKHPTWSLDRGHLANDADFDYDQKVLLKTYAMSNIIPQVSTVNRKTWIKAEKYERMAAMKTGSVHVINGVEYNDPDNILIKKSVSEVEKLKKKKLSAKYIKKLKKYDQKLRKKRILVPTGFWKAIIGKNFKKCFYYENKPINYKNDNLKDHLVSCEQFGL